MTTTTQSRHSLPLGENSNKISAKKTLHVNVSDYAVRTITRKIVRIKEERSLLYNMNVNLLPVYFNLHFCNKRCCVSLCHPFSKFSTFYFPYLYDTNEIISFEQQNENHLELQ